MNEQEKQLLKFIENGYSLEEIKEMTTIKTDELLPYFMTMLKKQIEIDSKIQIYATNTTKKIIYHINNLISNEKSNSYISAKKSKKYCNEITKLVCNINNKEYLLELKPLIFNLISKIKANKLLKKHCFSKEYEMIDNVIFNDFNLNETIKLLNKPDFNINYINNEHLIKFVISEYLQYLKNCNDKEKTDYFSLLIEQILLMKKFKISEKNKVDLISKLEFEKEKIKRNKQYDNRKKIMKSISDVSDKLKNKDNVLFKNKLNKLYIGKREDFRKDFTFTIDSPNTRIFDDALTFKNLKNGNYLIGIHIADPNALVYHQLIIDEDILVTENRINDVKDGVYYDNCPSKKAISLTKNTEKATKSLIVEITRFGEIVDYNLVRGLINVDCNYNYKDVEIILNDKNHFFHKDLNVLKDITLILNEKRKIKSIKTQLAIMKSGRLISCEAITNNSGIVIVEEAMVLYNTITPIYFEENNYPFIYVNRKINDNVLINEKELNMVMNQLIGQGHSQKLIAKAIISLYPQSTYSTKNKGNEIMEVDQYCRATSPLEEVKSMISSVLFDECYFQKPSEKSIYKLQDSCDAIVRNLNSKNYPANEEINKIAQSYKLVLKDIRNKNL